MKKIMGHAGYHRRVAINVGSGFVPGMNSVLMGAALAGGRLGWELVGIRDGFEGLLHPDRYPDRGLVPLSIELVENLDRRIDLHRCCPDFLAQRNGRRPFFKNR